MANPHKGEVAFKAGDDSYTLSFSANALAELEEMLGGVGVNEIGALMADPAKIRMTTMRTMFHAALLDRAPGLHPDEAKIIFSKIKPAEAVSLIVRAFAQAFPEAEGDANPPKPGQDGTGQSS